MGERALDVLIGVIVVAIIGVLGFYFLSQSDNGDDSASSDANEPVATVDMSEMANQGELPPLTEKQMRFLVYQPLELPAAYLDTNSDQAYVQSLDDVSSDLRDVWFESATRFDQIRDTYNWDTAVGAVYDTCRSDRPVSQILLEVSQLDSTAEAHTMTRDPLVTSYFRSLFFDVELADNVHGLRMVSILPDNEGECFEEGAYLHYLLFDHYGLLIGVQAYVQASADQAQADALLNELAVDVVARVNALLPEAMPPTPMPTGDEEIRLLTENTAVNDLAYLMPELSDVGLGGGARYYRLNNDVSHTYTLEEYIAAYQNLNLPELADTLSTAGSRYGMQGQAVRVWDTGGNCPEIVGTQVEIDVWLFNTPAGARDFMNDSSVQQAWINTGMVSEYIPQGDELLAVGNVETSCGPMQFVEKRTTYERLLITIAVYANPQAERSDVIDIVDAFQMATLSHVLLTGG